MSEQVCASKETQAKKETATPKTIGSLKQDHWILDNQEEQEAHPCAHHASQGIVCTYGSKECPGNPDHISQERTTEIIDASEGGGPELLEGSWRLTSQANKPLVKLKDKESGSGSAADRIIDKKDQSTIEPDPATPSKEEPTSLPLALGKIHQRLSKPEELKKLRPTSIQDSRASLTKINLRSV